MLISTKSCPTDLVTEHDRAAEALLVERIHELRPGDSILGEEGAAATGTTGYTSGISTRSTARPTTCTAIRCGRPRWRSPMTTACSPAPCMPRPPLNCSPLGAGRARRSTGHRYGRRRSPTLRLALVATGFGYVPRDARRAGPARLADVIGDIRDIRRGGSAALDLCYVAAGRVDGYYEIGINVWDVAAGELIAREAGCATSSIDAAPGRPAADLRRCAGDLRRALRQLVKHGNRDASPNMAADQAS